MNFFSYHSQGFKTIKIKYKMWVFQIQSLTVMFMSSVLEKYSF